MEKHFATDLEGMSIDGHQWEKSEFYWFTHCRHPTSMHSVEKWFLLV